MAELAKKISTFDSYKLRLKQSRNFCEPHWDRAIDNYKHYLGRLDVGGISEEDYPMESRMVIPLSNDIVETTIPRIIGKDPEYTVIAEEPSDVDYEQSAKSIIQIEYENAKLELLGEPIYLKLLKGVKEAIITGNAVLRPLWRREIRKASMYLANLEPAGIVDEFNAADVLKTAKEINKEGDVRWTKKLKDAPLLDDFDIKHKPFFLFFPDKAFDMPGRMRYKIDRDYMTFEELASEAEAFGYDEAKMQEVADLVDQGKGGFTSEIPKDFMQDYFELFADPDGEKTLSTDDDKVPLLVVDKMWENGIVHVFVNEKYQLTPEPGMRSPYDLMFDPFIFIGDTPMPHSYFNRSVIDAIKKMEDGVTDLWNMRYDNLMQAMLNFWLVNSNFVAEDDEFVPVPNSITSVTDIDRAVKAIKGNDVTGSAFTEANELVKMIREITGVNDYVKGNEGEKLAGRTYGGLRLVQEMANARFIVKSRMLEKTGLKSLGYFILEMSRQFIDKDRIKRMIGQFGEIVTHEAKVGDLKSIKGFMDIRVIPNASAVVDQQAEAIKLNSVADRFISEKGPFANIPDIVYDKFLLKYLQGYNITDAPYWVKAIQEARAKALKLESKPTPSVDGGVPIKPPIIPGVPGIAPPRPGVGVPPVSGMGTVPVIQSDQITNQPNPLEQILGAGNLPPVAKIL